MVSQSGTAAVGACLKDVSDGLLQYPVRGSGRQVGALLRPPVGRSQAAKGGRPGSPPAAAGTEAGVAGTNNKACEFLIAPLDHAAWCGACPLLLDNQLCTHLQLSSMVSSMPKKLESPESSAGATSALPARMRCARWPPMDCRRRKCRGLSTAGKQAFRQRPSAALCVSVGHPLQNPTQPQLPGLPPSQRWWSCMQ